MHALDRGSSLDNNPLRSETGQFRVAVWPAEAYVRRKHREKRKFAKLNKKKRDLSMNKPASSTPWLGPNSHNNASDEDSDEMSAISVSSVFSEGGQSNAGIGGRGALSSAFFMCLVLDNPFNPENEPEKPIDSSLFQGYEVFEDIYLESGGGGGGGRSPHVIDGKGKTNNKEVSPPELSESVGRPAVGYKYDSTGEETIALLDGNDEESGSRRPHDFLEHGENVLTGQPCSTSKSSVSDAIGSKLLPENMRAGLKDEDFLREPSSPIVGSHSAKGWSETDFGLPAEGFAPNKFQKVVEIILRLQKRCLDVYPLNMLSEADFSECGNANYFKGWKLNRAELLTSPDQSLLYVKVHASRRVLCRFAEALSIPLPTHDYSFGGGAAMPYSAKLEAELTRSVKKYFRTFEPHNAHLGDKAKGFDVQTPHRMRLLVRYLREQWRFGGCGLQLNEMKRKQILVKDYFPLHNKAFIEKHDLETWASLNPFKVFKGFFADKTESLTMYFGEQVGLYFQWVREYILVLIALGFVGLLMGASTRIFGHTALTNASFAVACVTWAFYWNLHWNRKESFFSIDNCQEHQLEQEPVRDEFRVGSLEVVECADLYRMRFKYPLSLRVTADGSFLNLYYSNAKRLCTRYLISYPVVFFLTAAMIAVLTLINFWRFENSDDELISYTTSVLSVIAGQVFGVLFELIVGLLNWCENNRTDADEDNERIYKSFFFYFFSYYFSLFSICLWPLEGPSYIRLQQLQAQMLVICIVKPVIATVSGLAIPWLMCSLRKRYDVAGGFCSTVMSLLCCKSVRKMMEARDIDPDDEGTQMWFESNLQPFDSTAKDYLRVTLQFGYMSMFAATFPWAAPAALLYNVIDRRADAARILHYCKRPMAKPSANIGPWKSIFKIISVCAVVTNCYLICVLSPIYDKIGLGEKAKESEGFKWIGYIVVQYGLFVIGMAMATVVPPIPEASHKLLLKRFLLTNPAIRQRFYDRSKAEALAAIEDVARVDNRDM